MVTRRLIEMAYAIQKRAWRLFRPRTRGVKVMLFNAAGDLLLIRNSYGRSDLFVLPGGGVRPWEEPATAAKREVKEELGLDVATLTLRSRHSSSAEGKRDEIHLFEAVTHGSPKADNFEVLEICFASPQDLPETTSDATRRRVDEYLGRRIPDGSW